MSGPKLVKKLSIATVIGKVPTEVRTITNADGKEEKVVRGIEQHLVRVVGLADGFKTGNSNFGPWLSFSGMFEATNVLTGELYRSANVFLPDVAGEMLLPVVKAANGAQVTIGFDIGAKPFNNAQGYEYTVTPLTKPAENDPLSALKASVFADVPALPSPKAATPAQAELSVDQTAAAEPAVETKTEEAPATDASKSGSKKK